MDIHVQKLSEYKAAMNIHRNQLATSDDPTLDEPLAIEGISNLITENLASSGFDTLRKVLNSTPEQLATIPGISVDMVDKILDQIRKKIF